MQHTPFVCIYASQVAMCIGANKHKKISEAMELMWQRCDHAGFKAAMTRNAMKTDDELADAIIKSNAGVKDLVDLTLTAPCDSSDQVAKQYDTVTKELQAVPLPDEDRKLVDDVLKRNLYTGYGNVNESRVLDYIRTHLGIACREDHTFYKLQQGTCTGAWGSLPWYVGGKIDAIEEKRTLLIEVKNRVNRLFYRIPFYEQVQVQTYLHLLDLERAVLVECLKSSGAPPKHPHLMLDRDACHGLDRAPEPTEAEDGHAAPADNNLAVNVIPIRRDRELWDREIVPKLQGFVDFLARLLNDPALQDRYLQSKRRSAMVTSHVNNYIKFSPSSC